MAHRLLGAAFGRNQRDLKHDVTIIGDL